MGVRRAVAVRHVVAIGLALQLAACALAPPPAATTDRDANRESVLAIAWMRSSLEHRFLAEQTYRAATAALDRAVSEPGTAALEQEAMADFAALPPAVIMDIDETTIDTMAFAAQLVRDRRYFDREVAARDWPAFLRDPANAAEVPGAAAFVNAVQARGLRVVFVTNRDCPVPPAATPDAPCAEREGAVKALARLGIRVREEDVWMAGGAERWAADKTGRRQALAKRYRIVMLLGDDLQDFVPEALAERMRAGETRGEDRLGTRWFLLPNPVYGSWYRHLARACTQGGARPELAYECFWRSLTSPPAPHY
jgi:acid phosphatase